MVAFETGGLTVRTREDFNAAFVFHQGPELYLGRDNLFQPGQTEVIERRKQDLFLQTVFYHHVPGLLLNTGIISIVGFDFDVGKKILACCPFTVLFKGRNLLRCVAILPEVRGIETAELRIAEVTDTSGAVCGAVYPLVVMNDKDTVTGQVDIQFDSIRSHLRRLAEGEHGVFRICTAVPAVSHNFHVF